MDIIFPAASIEKLPWLSQPPIRSKVLEISKKLAAAEQKSANIQATIEGINANPPFLKKHLLKKRAALIKSLNLTDAAIIAAQEKILFDLEKAALETQKDATEAKKVTLMDDLYNFLKAILTALNISPRPNEDAWIRMLPDQPIGAGIPVLTAKNVFDNCVKKAVERERCVFIASELKSKRKIAEKEAKRAAQRERDDAVLAFTNASFNTAVTAVFQRQNQHQNRRQRRPQTQQSQRRNPRRTVTTPQATQSRQPSRRNFSARRSGDTVGRAQPSRTSRTTSRSGNVTGRRSTGPSSGQQRRQPTTVANRARSPYPLRRTAARVGHAARNGVRHA
jgi:hypothetical protein